jgi:protein TonB
MHATPSYRDPAIEFRDMTDADCECRGLVVRCPWGGAQMNTAARIPLVLPVAATITIGLFLMMRNLIDVGEVVIPVVEDPPDIVIAFDIEEEGLPPPLTPDVIEPVEPPPPPPTVITDVAVVDPGPTATNYRPPVIAGPEIAHTGGLVPPEGAPQPVVRIEPTYPARQLEREIEAQCTVIFDITPGGTTANVSVLSCSATGFDRASISAVQRWRYRPQIVNGEPTLFRGATTQLAYRIAD